jgi:hypothetical protein
MLGLAFARRPPPLAPPAGAQKGEADGIATDQQRCLASLSPGAPRAARVGLRVSLPTTLGAPPHGRARRGKAGGGASAVELFDFGALEPLQPFPPSLAPLLTAVALQPSQRPTAPKARGAHRGRLGSAVFALLSPGRAAGVEGERAASALTQTAKTLAALCTAAAARQLESDRQR